MTTNNIVNTMRITKVAQFADACNSKTHDEIYDLFELDISEELRDEIYFHHTNGGTEPVREAMWSIGRMHNVQSLKDY